MAQEFAWLLAFPLQRPCATLECRLGPCHVHGHIWATFKRQVTPREGTSREGGISDLGSALLWVHLLTTGDADGLEGREQVETGHSGPVPADTGMGWFWDGHTSLFSISALLAVTLELRFVNTIS